MTTNALGIFDATNVTVIHKSQSVATLRCTNTLIFVMKDRLLPDTVATMEMALFRLESARRKLSVSLGCILSPLPVPDSTPHACNYFAETVIQTMIVKDR